MAKRHKDPKGKSLNRRKIERHTKAFFQEYSDQPIDYRTLAAYIGVKDTYSLRLIGDTLLDMEHQGLLKSVGHGRFIPISNHDTLETTIALQKSGAGICMLPNDTEVFIPQRKTLHALNGDTVLIAYRYNRKYRKVEGEVLEIVERARDSFVGIIQLDTRFAFLVPDSRHMPYDVYIPLEELQGAKHGQKAIVELTDWPRDARNPYGRVVEVLGDAGDNEVEMHAILSAFDLPYRYPEEVEAYANQLTDGITKKEVAKRRDFREVFTLTIDPETAKDFDDAISLQTLPNGHLEVGVHIADVSHYVTPGSILDEEAYNRATSIYLVDRTIPMLPEHLSNGICSLRPDEDKLTYSAVFEMNGQGEVLDYWLGRTVIRSNARLTYEQAQAAIEGEESPYAEQLLQLNAISQALRKRRFEEGAVDFSSTEVRFKLDAKGKPLDVIPEVYNESHMLIEELMLLANRTVATFVGKKKRGESVRPFVYRVHDKPNPEKLEAFCGVLAKFGHVYKGDTTRMDGKAITELINSAKGSPEQHFVDILAIRSMAKAIYTTQNIGHFGLGFEFYTHFTSPIRRYPDIMVHRILTAELEKGKSAGQGDLEEWCEHSSEMEKLSAEAERASIKYKQVEYMSARKGEQFDGIISGVSDFGFFVELTENKCEGLVPLRDLQDDYYAYDAEEFAIEGERSGRVFRLGDAVRVEVQRTDLMHRQLDFTLVGHLGEEVAHSASVPRAQRLNPRHDTARHRKTSKGKSRVRSARKSGKRRR